MAFIDYDNISIPAKNYFGVNYIDFNKLRQTLLSNCRDVGCNLYLPHTLRSLIGPIQKSGLRVNVVSPRKSVDGKLIFDILTNAYSNTYDVAVIASGDRDYMDVIQHVKTLNKEVVVASFSRNLAHALINVADEILDLDAQATTISAQVYNYTCVNCGNPFTEPFRIFNPKPLCKNCRP